MSYLKLIGARRKTKDLPGIKKLQLSEQQKALVSQGVCIKCTTANAAKTSYLCKSCQEDDRMEDIRSDIAALRRKLLNKQEN